MAEEDSCEDTALPHAEVAAPTSARGPALANLAASLGSHGGDEAAPELVKVGARCWCGASNASGSMMHQQRPVVRVGNRRRRPPPPARGAQFTFKFTDGRAPETISVRGRDR